MPRSASSIEDAGPQSGHWQTPDSGLAKVHSDGVPNQRMACSVSSAISARYDGCHSVRFLGRPHMSFAGIAIIAYQRNMKVPRNGSAPESKANVWACRCLHRSLHHELSHERGTGCCRNRGSNTWAVNVTPRPGCAAFSWLSVGIGPKAKVAVSVPWAIIDQGQKLRRPKGVSR